MKRPRSQSSLREPLLSSSEDADARLLRPPAPPPAPSSAPSGSRPKGAPSSRRGSTALASPLPDPPLPRSDGRLEDGSHSSRFAFEREMQAVVFVEDALNGRSIDHKAGTQTLRLYRAYYSRAAQSALMITIAMNLCLAFLEEPSAVDNVPRVVVLLLDLLTLLLFAFDAWVKYTLFGSTRFKSDPWLISYVSVIVVSLVDLLVDFGMESDHPVKVRRMLRPFFLAQNSTLIKKTLKNISKSVPEIANVLFLLLLHLFTFALIGRLVFWNSLEGERYFSSLQQSLLSLFESLTTSNFPDVMMPIYNASRWSALYFVCFLVVGLFCLMNLLTAVIYNQFRGYLAGSMQTTYFRRRVGLRAAFEIFRYLEWSKRHSEFLRSTRPSRAGTLRSGRSVPTSPVPSRPVSPTPPGGKAAGGGDPGTARAVLVANSPPNVATGADDAHAAPEAYASQPASPQPPNSGASFAMQSPSMPREASSGGAISTDSVRLLVERINLPAKTKLGLLSSLRRRDDDPEGERSLTLTEFYALLEPDILDLLAREKGKPDALDADGYFDSAFITSPSSPAPFGRANARSHSTLSSLSQSSTGAARVWERLVKFAQRLVAKSWYRYISMFLVLANIVSITIHLSISDYTTSKSLEIFRAVGLAFAAACVLEIAVRIVAAGLLNFLSQNLWNLFDFALILGLVVVQILGVAYYPLWETLEDNSPQLDEAWKLVRIRDILFILRLALLIRDVEGRLGLIASTIAHLVSSLAAFAGVFVIIYYDFASIGMELFAGSIQVNDPRLNGTAFAELEFWPNSFNSFPETLVTLWELMIVNNWIVIMDAHAKVTSDWAKIYFILWYVTAVIVAMNLFIALLLETFIIKWTSSVWSASTTNTLSEELQLRSPISPSQSTRTEAALFATRPAGTLHSLSMTLAKEERDRSGADTTYTDASRAGAAPPIPLSVGGDGASAGPERTSTTRQTVTVSENEPSVDVYDMAQIPGRTQSTVRSGTLVSHAPSTAGATTLSTLLGPMSTQRSRSRTVIAASNPLQDLFRSNIQEPDDQEVLDAVLDHAELFYLSVR